MCTINHQARIEIIVLLLSSIGCSAITNGSKNDYQRSLETQFQVKNFEVCTLAHIGNTIENQIPAACDVKYPNAETKLQTLLTLELCGVDIPHHQDGYYSPLLLSPLGNILYELQEVFVLPVTPITDILAQGEQIKPINNTPLNGSFVVPASVFVKSESSGVHLNAEVVALGIGSYNPETAEGCPGVENIRKAAGLEKLDQ